MAILKNLRILPYVNCTLIKRILATDTLKRWKVRGGGSHLLLVLTVGFTEPATLPLPPLLQKLAVMAARYCLVDFSGLHPIWRRSFFRMLCGDWGCCVCWHFNAQLFW